MSHNQPLLPSSSPTSIFSSSHLLSLCNLIFHLYLFSPVVLSPLSFLPLFTLSLPFSLPPPPPPSLILSPSLHRTYQLKADSQSEAESWVSALKQTQVSGIPLSEHQLTGNKIPIIVHKCLQFVESAGLDEEGLYRLNGEKAKIKKLLSAFNQGKGPSIKHLYLFVYSLPPPPHTHSTAQLLTNTYKHTLIL